MGSIYAAAEIRNPKSEGRNPAKRDEGRNPNNAILCGLVIFFDLRNSDFELDEVGPLESRVKLAAFLGSIAVIQDSVVGGFVFRVLRFKPLYLGRDLIANANHFGPDGCRAL